MTTAYRRAFRHADEVAAASGPRSALNTASEMAEGLILFLDERVVDRDPGDLTSDYYREVARQSQQVGMYLSKVEHIRSAAVSQLAHINSTSQNADRTRVLSRFARRAWLVLSTLTTAWGVLAGVALSKSIWLRPTTAVYGLFVAAALMATMYTISRQAVDKGSRKR